MSQEKTKTMVRHMGKKALTQKEVAALVNERGQRILQKFKQVAVSGISDPKLVLVLEDVKAYWEDVFRPGLTSFCCEAVGGKQEVADNASLIITLASAGGGIHDDILDKSLNKHFRMTIFGRHGLDIALLIGDLLILEGWSMLAALAEQTGDCQKTAKIIRSFGSLSVDVCEAEFLEISCRRNLDTELRRFQTILWKSMGDIEACARLGAMLGDGSNKEVNALADYGRRLGFMFRLVEEVKDVRNIAGTLPQRLENESVPLPILYAAQTSKKRYTEIKSILEKSFIVPLDTRELLRFCIEAEAFPYVLHLAEQNARKAAFSLNQIKPSAARIALELIIKKPLTDITELCL